ncbi:uncharacterized protein LOC113290737 [Papaver somniferum]|uniref:uncharacterized protein LOC113290737 n=1 Tax=Papaver somniferum TaxID=3469 RepID=UPI000E702DB2|nr:uncharacterized protein LOC113290737 [Papaver somniferum]
MNVPSTGEDYLIWKPDSFCNNAIETTDHLLGECDCARAIWMEVNVNISGILHELMCTIWYTWKDMCNIVFQNTKPNAQGTIIRIQYLVQLCNVSNGNNIMNRTNDMQIKQWIPPEYGYVKCNITASYMPDTKRGSLGLIVSDCAGFTLGVKGINLEEKVDEEYGAEYFECKALEMAVEWTESLKYNKVIFKIDCENVFLSLQRNESQVHWFNQNTIIYLKNKFTSNKLWFCKLVNRLGNNVAHNLTKKARTTATNFCYLSDYPPNIVKWMEEYYVILHNR